MIIEPINDKLFGISSVLPTEYVEKLLALDWLNLPCEASPNQKHMFRKRIKHEEVPLLFDINLYLSEHCKELGLMLDFDFDSIATIWWLDMPGMTSGIHFDTADHPVMQLYWLAPDTTYGTTFYNKMTLRPTQDDIIKEFKFIPNTGYINDLTGVVTDRIHHGMLNPVPENSIRVSSMTQFLKNEK